MPTEPRIDLSSLPSAGNAVAEHRAARHRALSRLHNFHLACAFAASNNTLSIVRIVDLESARRW